MPAKTWVFYLRDALFALDQPIVVPIDAPSTTILNMERAADQSAETWRAHFATLGQHPLVSLGMASDRGTGLMAGAQEACELAVWVTEYCHEVRGRDEVRHPVARQAYAAIAQEYEAARTLANATREAHLQKRRAHSDPASRTCQHAVELYDPCALLLHLLRAALHGGSPQGQCRPPAQGRSALRLVFAMMEALDCAALRHPLQPIRPQLEALVTPCTQGDVMAAALRALVPPEALDFLVLAWHHAHFSPPARAQSKGYHQRARDCWLACAAGLRGAAFDTLQACVVDQLDSIGRASSRVEMVNALLRPYLNSCQGQLTQEPFTLIMFYPNHRRSQSGKRQGQAPRELLTGKPLDAPWWEL
jgi:hypothetical protein